MLNVSLFNDASSISNHIPYSGKLIGELCITGDTKEFGLAWVEM